MAAGARTDGLAIGALITGIASLVCSFLCFGIALGPAAAIMGYISRQRIAAGGGSVVGGGLAIAGLVLGIVGFLASVGWFAFWVILGNFGRSSST